MPIGSVFPLRSSSCFPSLLWWVRIVRWGAATFHECRIWRQWTRLPAGTWMGLV